MLGRRISNTVGSLAVVASLFVATVLAPAPPAKARSAALPGPVAAVVERVVDGDTLAVRARIWIGQELSILVRIRGIDTAELRARCDAERRQAVAARAFVDGLVRGQTVRLTDIDGGKYAGRVLAEVWTAGGDNLGALLLSSGLAEPYPRRRPACRS